MRALLRKPLFATGSRPVTTSRPPTLAALALAIIFILGGGLLFVGCGEEAATPSTQEVGNVGTVDKIIHTDEEWREILPPERYEVLREKGTERPFTGEYDDHWEDGVYACYACELPLFDSTTKFHSGSGWPSFWQPITPEAVEEHADSSYGMQRVEVTCARCGGHLGHVFTDGPEPTGLRYCINSASLQFVPR